MNSFFYIRQILILLLFFYMEGNFPRASDILRTEEVKLEQQLVTFKGTVKDTEGKPVVGTTITIVELNTRTMTNENGDFSIRSVPSGNYTINVMHISYENRKF